MLSNFAPIALFAYNRPRHLQETLTALAKNELAQATDLYLFCDGDKETDSIDAIKEVRALAHAARGFANLFVIERSENWGLARSIITGVTEICAKHGRVIVLEDDLVTSPSFLSFMNAGLDLYASDPQVASIHGYLYPIETPLPETFFLRGADCWGWATWERAWRDFRSNGADLLREIEEQNLAHIFDFEGAYPYTQMLRDQIAGRNNSWAIRWHASAFLANRFTLYPGKSLVHNIGIDGSGTHSGFSKDYAVKLSSTSAGIKKISIAEDAQAREMIRQFLSKQHLQATEKLVASTNNPIRSFRNFLQRVLK